MATLAEMAMKADLGLPEWQDYGNCQGHDPNIFYPSRGESNMEAKEICRACVVREECLTHALTHGEKFGVWGGMSERERRRVKRERALARAASQSAA